MPLVGGRPIVEKRPLPIDDADWIRRFSSFISGISLVPFMFLLSLFVLLRLNGLDKLIVSGYLNLIQMNETYPNLLQPNLT